MSKPCRSSGLGTSRNRWSWRARNWRAGRSRTGTPPTAAGVVAVASSRISGAAVQGPDPGNGFPTCRVVELHATDPCRRPDAQPVVQAEGIQICLAVIADDGFGGLLAF